MPCCSLPFTRQKFYFFYNSLSSLFMILKGFSLKIAVKSLPLFPNEAMLTRHFHSVSTIVQSETQWVAKRGRILPRAFAWLFINDNCQRKEHTSYRQHAHTRARMHRKPLFGDRSKLFDNLHKCHYVPAAQMQTVVLMVVIKQSSAELIVDGDTWRAAWPVKGRKY